MATAKRSRPDAITVHRRGARDWVSGKRPPDAKRKLIVDSCFPRSECAGTGPMRADLEHLAGNREPKNVHFLGQVDTQERDELIAQLSFTVLPSRAYETLGKTILESYAPGRAVIATDLGSRRESVQEGETGLPYRGEMWSSWRERCRSYGSVRNWQQGWGEAGYQLVQPKHSPDDHYHAMESIYRRMVSSSEPIRSTGSSRPVVPSKKIVRSGLPSSERGASIGKYSGIEGYYEEVGSSSRTRVTTSPYTAEDISHHDKPETMECASSACPRCDRNRSRRPFPHCWRNSKNS
jgi:hypothetical protein